MEIFPTNSASPNTALWEERWLSPANARENMQKKTETAIEKITEIKNCFIH